MCVCYVCSVAKSCPTLWDPRDCCTPGFPVLHYLPEFDQTHVHWVDDAIQPSHPLSPASPPALNLSQHQGLFQWVNSLQKVAKVLELQLASCGRQTEKYHTQFLPLQCSQPPEENCHTQSLSRNMEGLLVKFALLFNVYVLSCSNQSSRGLQSSLSCVPRGLP